MFLTKSSSALTIKLTKFKDHSIYRRFPREKKSPHKKQGKWKMYSGCRCCSTSTWGWPSLSVCPAHRCRCSPIGPSVFSLHQEELEHETAPGKESSTSSPCKMLLRYFNSSSSKCTHNTSPCNTHLRLVKTRTHKEFSGNQKNTRKGDLIKSFSLVSPKSTLISIKYLLSTHLQTPRDTQTTQCKLPRKLDSLTMLHLDYHHLLIFPPLTHTLKFALSFTVEFPWWQDVKMDLPPKSKLEPFSFLMQDI